MVRRPLLAAASGEARALPGAYGSAGSAGALVLVRRAPSLHLGGVSAMAPPTAPLGRPASAAVPGLMVVRRPTLTVVTGMARPSAPVLTRVHGAFGPVGAIGLARAEEEDQVISDPSVLAALDEHAYNVELFDSIHRRWCGALLLL
eukprot:scaffold11043_cov111-Isochrysis_galbana.AAC.1